MSYNIPNRQAQKETKKRLPLWLHWWYQLPVSEQDRIFALTPVMSLAVFIGFVLLSYTYLNKQQHEREIINMQHSAATVSQQIRLTLIENEELLQHIGTTTLKAPHPKQMFSSLSSAALNKRPEFSAIYLHDFTSGTTYAYPESSLDPSVNRFNPDQVLESTKTGPKLSSSEFSTIEFTYSAPFFNTENRAKMYASLVLPDQQTHSHYLLTAVYDLDKLLSKIVPADVSLYTNIWLQGKNGETLAATNPQALLLQENIETTPPIVVTPHRFGGEISIFAQSTRVQRTLSGNFLFWFTVGLSLFTGTLIIMNWRHTHFLVNAQHAAQRESNFRRAIEDSLTTGLQGIDLHHRINYVNPAFCQMVGYQEHELIGRKAPFPYWPGNDVKDLDEKQQKFEEMLHVDGAEVQLRRSNGEVFYAMLHVAPLINEIGEQSGWISSISDISESKRSREDLALAGQRFTTVLEGMDAAISVTAVGSSTLLFTNNAYRNLFGNSKEIHSLLTQELKHMYPPPANTATDNVSTSDLTENNASAYFKEKMLLKYYVEEQDRWIEVRSQFLPWVDGRLAQMLVITDITERHKAEELAAIQAQQTEAAGRLITMGEMASSVAHELNQPLTAIQNYCSGLIHRIQNNALSQEELLKALEKTAKQADRAGKITQRIRAFVKKNTPNRLMTTVREVIDNIYEFIEIDAQRRNIKVDIHIEENLPAIFIDPILIEQVLLNLTRNATEAINEAQRPANQRLMRIEIKRVTSSTESAKELEFSVTDSGTGMPQDVIEHMFDAFFTTKPSGVGIGLNLCRSIVESHGGHLYFQNICNENILSGCRFAFTLPINFKQKIEEE